MKGKNKLVPRLLGINKESVLRVDEKTKQVLKVWPLTQVRRWAASPNSFTLVRIFFFYYYYIYYFWMKSWNFVLIICSYFVLYWSILFLNYFFCLFLGFWWLYRRLLFSTNWWRRTNQSTYCWVYWYHFEKGIFIVNCCCSC